MDVPSGSHLGGPWTLEAHETSVPVSLPTLTVNRPPLVGNRRSVPGSGGETHHHEGRRKLLGRGGGGTCQRHRVYFGDIRTEVPPVSLKGL